MKLRNKKTGEIKNAVDIDMYTDSVYLKVSTGEFDNETIEYHSLAELNAEWEDYEEPKDYYYISDFGSHICECEIGLYPADEENRKQIGNYFETKEEAEQAVEKLKAWKRLKDKGFRFIPEASYVEEQPKETGESMMLIACTMNDYRDFVFGDNADIKLLFSEVKNEQI